MSPFSPDDMLGVGNSLLTSIKNRIKQGLDVNDSPAKPLKGATKGFVPYAQQKQKHGRKGIRDLVNTGQLMESIQVLSVNQEGGKIGSNNPVKAAILAKNNKRSPQFGISANDLTVMNQKALELVKGKVKMTKE